MSQVSSPKPVFEFSPKFRLSLSSYILYVLRIKPLVLIAEIRGRQVIDAYEAENMAIKMLRIQTLDQKSLTTKYFSAKIIVLKNLANCILEIVAYLSLYLSSGVWILFN